MVYSTCTFSVEENEGTLKYILENYPDMHVIPIEQQGDGLMAGHPGGLTARKKSLMHGVSGPIIFMGKAILRPCFKRRAAAAL